MIIVFHSYCSLIGRSIIHRSIKCRIYILTSLLNVSSLSCLSMFCRTSGSKVCHVALSGGISVQVCLSFKLPSQRLAIMFVTQIARIDRCLYCLIY